MQSTLFLRRTIEIGVSYIKIWANGMASRHTERMLWHRPAYAFIFFKLISQISSSQVLWYLHKTCRLGIFHTVEYFRQQIKARNGLLLWRRRRQWWSWQWISGSISTVYAPCTRSVSDKTRYLLSGFHMSFSFLISALQTPSSFVLTAAIRGSWGSESEVSDTKSFRAGMWTPLGLS